jgi:amino acid adenylation domain-containing protein
MRGRSMSYSELDRSSNQLAHALRANGLEKQDRVGLFLHKGLELGVAIYGSLKAGGVFVPLDPFMPPERLALIVQDCGIRHLVTSDALIDTVARAGLDAELCVYGTNRDVGFSRFGWEEIRACPDTLPDVWIIDQDLGYIMYTSGSTGIPKGMMHSHLGSISYARWGATHVGLVPADRVASHAPLHFDLSIFDFFSTVQAGATVVMVPEPVTKFPASWTQYIEDERISVVFTVPFTLMEMLERGALGQRDLASLRHILFGGEPFPPRQLAELMRALPAVRFTNVYGPAEAPSCTCYDVPPLRADHDEPIPIGTVSANSADLIIDEHDADCGVDEPGELCIRSSTLTRGYWNRPELNERVFLRRPGPGPFPDVYFRTGDMVVRHQDGLLRFLGRRDRMVKTRGHRVELDEVESVLASHPDVADVATYTVPDTRGSKAILATVTLRDSASVDTPGLLRYARGKLPGYALPTEIEIVDALPRTSGGKIDRQRLVEQRPLPSDV